MRVIRWFFGAVTLIVFLIVFFSWMSILAGPSVERDSTLLITLDGPLPEAPVVDLAVLLGEEPKRTLRSVVQSLERAATDERIRGVVLDVGQPQIGFAQLEEISGAMARFRESGKFSIGFLETAGEVSRGDGALALAALADEVVLAPPGDVNLVGLRTEPMFYGGTFEMLGIDVHFEKRGQYKSAANQFTDRAMDPPMRESLKELVEDLQGQLVDLIADRRGVTSEKVTEWISRGPYLAPEALQLGIVDRLAYWDEVASDVEKRVSREKSWVSVSRYWLEGRPHSSGTSVALLIGEGAVTRGEGGGGLGDDAVMASDPMVRALREIRESDAQALIFRVDSPGGSYIASDLIRREVELTRAAGIPVVISMGNVAASGGYFVSMDADHILASANTITGSIGVYNGTFDLSGAFNKVGVTTDSLQTAPNADAFSTFAPIDERREAIVAKFADRVYVDFTTKVAEKRSIPLSSVQQIAQGRVWSGQDALENKLVDSIGGLHEAIEKARNLAELEADAPLRIDVWPQVDDPAQVLRSVLRGTVRGAETIDRARIPLEAASRVWQSLGAVRGDAPLLMPTALPSLF
ncbi:MAG: signal peptide peptidase SppA [Myxococcota bacterium]